MERKIREEKGKERKELNTCFLKITQSQFVHSTVSNFTSLYLPPDPV